MSIVFTSVFTACVKDKGLPVEEECPEKEVYYKADVQTLFDTHCNTQGCHAGPAPAGGLSLEANLSFEELNRPGKGYVNTANPTVSVLYSQLNSINNPMPPTGKLAPCDIRIIYDWMAQGAKNN